MKCRNWRPENPERPGKSGRTGRAGRSGKIRNLRKPPEKARQGRSGKSGILRKIPSASSPARKYMLFAPKPQALRRFICPATAHLRTKCRTPLRCGPQNTPAPHHNPYPCVSLRNSPKAAPENPEPPEKPENPEAPEKPETPEHPKPSGTSASARITPIICNLTYYNLRHNTHILIINNKLFALFLARFKIKPYLCIV